jgi:CubicO group peptidase (beta-lactamase class C family)
MGSQSVYSTPADYARFLGMWRGGGALEGKRVLPEAAVEKALTPHSPMTLIGSPAPFPTGFSDLEVWHGEMAMIWRTPEGGNGTTSDESTAVGYLGSDGTFAWAFPEQDLMVLFFTQSRGQDVHLELEALLSRLFLEG